MNSSNQRMCQLDMHETVGADFATTFVAQNWLRNRNTVEFLGIWEQLNNPNFKGGEFETFERPEPALDGFSNSLEFEGLSRGANANPIEFDGIMLKGASFQRVQQSTPRRPTPA